ncbi:MAG: hypothetical protein HY319_03790 [Armatimonadetes bacterium]|nr:hypothetical protein [Armatimonadota bacterium]
MNQRGSGGSTLIELLIYSSLSLILLAGLYATSELSYRYYAAGESATGAQQETLKGATGIADALRGAAAETVTIQTEPPALRFLSSGSADQILFDHNAGAELMWKRWACIYLDEDTRELVLKQVDLSASSPEIPADAPALATMIADGSLESRILARHIDELSFLAAAADNATDTLVTYTLTARTDSPRLGDNRISLTSRTLIKNQD